MQYSEVCDRILCHFWQWQSLTAGLLALLAAGITICVMKKQITQNDLARARDLARKEKAYKARMNPALSNLCNYSSDCLRVLISNDDHRELPPEPLEEIKTISDAIEFADEESAEAMSEMVSQYQIHRSRLRGFLDREEYTPTDLWTAEMVYGATLLHFQITNMFEYARRMEEKVSTREPSREQMMNELKNIVGVRRYVDIENDLSKVINIIERRHVDV